MTKDEGREPYRVLSWGCGAPSTTLGVLSALGHIERLDAIITADTGWERRRTYEVRDWYVDWFRAKGLRVEVLGGRDIRRDAAKTPTHMPFWTSSGGPLRRQCTREYKIRPVRRRSRELIGLHASLPPNPEAGAIEQWLGFTWEETSRVRDSDVEYIVKRYPLIEMRWTRRHCISFLEGEGLPVPVASACIGCPYRDAGSWLDIRENDPHEFDDAVAFDEANRRNPLYERGECTDDTVFIYKDANDVPRPLRLADLEGDAAKRGKKGGQMWLDMCDGPCMT